jgi:RHS repeat-associated protein
MPSHSCSTAPAHRLVGDPVDTLTGAVFDRKLEFRLTGPLELWWYRHYDSSQNRRRVALGWGHTHDFDRTLRFERDELQYEAPVGRVFPFPWLEKDGDKIARHGFRLFRLSHTRYQLVPHAEPAMEFEFHDLHQPARLRRLFQRGHQIVFQYNTARQLERIFDSAGRTVSVIEAADGRLISLTLEGENGAPGKLLVAYEYDMRGNLIASRNADGHGYAFTYDAENRVLERRGRKGFKFRSTYDEQGRCVRLTGDDGIHDVRLTYKVPGRVTQVQRADGGIWTYNFDARGGLTKIRDPLGGVQQFLRDPSGLVIAEVDPKLNLTRLVYDATGAPAAKVPPIGSSVRLPEDPNAPDPLAHRVAANPAEYEYGRWLDLKAMTLPEACVAQGLPLPFEAKRCVSTRPEGVNPKANGDGFRVRPLGAKWWPEPEHGRIFNDLGKLVAQRDDWGRLRQWTYDASGNLAQYTDFDGGKWSYEYGSWHFLRELTNPAGAKVKYSYTAEGKVANFTDAAGTRSEYCYDLKDELIEVRRHGKTRDHYTRDAAGNLIAKHASDGRLLLQFEIGPGNIRVKRTLASGDEHQFEYDKSGRHLRSATKKDAIEFAYDRRGNRTVEKRNGRGVKHRFQSLHARATTLIFDRFKVHYKLRADGTLLITDPAGKMQRVTFRAHGVIERRFSNGSSEFSQYDGQGRCLFKYAQRKIASDWSRRYRWSGEGELQRVEDNLYGEIRHEYNAAHRLRRRVVAGQVEAYEMDASDNLLRQPGLREVTLLEGNRLQSVNGLGVAYNDRNHVEVHQTLDGPVRYAYDSRDQLVRVETPRGVWEADYDALGRRTRKSWSGRTTEFYWFADQLIAEVAADGKLRLYIYADSLALTPLFFLDYDSVEAPPESCRRYFVFADQIGTPCLIEDEDGTEVWRARIQPFGTAQVETGKQFEFNLRFPGHYHDAELGLNYNRFRYYDPLAGRYLQSDPWGIAGGYNLYAYRSNPLLQVDVRGLGEENSENGQGCPEDGTDNESLWEAMARGAPLGEEDEEPQSTSRGPFSFEQDEIDDSKAKVAKAVDEVEQVMTDGEKERTTFGVAEVEKEDGSTEVQVAAAGADGYVPPRVRDAVQDSTGEEPVVVRNKDEDADSTNRGNDAEQTLGRGAKQNGDEIKAVGATRPMCPACKGQADEDGYGDRVATPIKHDHDD